MRVAILISVTLLLASCVHAVGPIPSGMAEKEYAWRQARAAAAMHCDQQQLKHEGFGTDRHLFIGCGQELEMLSEDDMREHRPGPASRFAIEIPCDVRKTTDQRIDRDTRVVEGCGQRVTYIWDCSSVPYKWIANLTRKE